MPGTISGSTYFRLIGDLTSADPERLTEISRIPFQNGTRIDEKGLPALVDAVSRTFSIE